MTRGADGPGPLRGAVVDPARPHRQLKIAFSLLAAVTVVGTIGYRILGLPMVDAFYQTVISVSTVGYRELGDVDDRYKIYTVLVIMSGVGTAFYTFGVLLETLVEGRLTDTFGRRRMQRKIDELKGHVILCGFGRVGRAIRAQLRNSERAVVVVDNDPDRLDASTGLFLVGDATDDAVLRQAGIERAHSLVAALNTDADNLYVTLSGRSLNRTLFIVARARIEAAEAKLAQAGADRVVNPQHIGGQRIAAMIAQPSVADFLDVVMHDGSLEFRLEEVPIPESSPMAGLSLRDAHVRDRTGALILAMRDGAGRFLTNPSPDTAIKAGEVLIAIGTEAQLHGLRGAAGLPAPR